MPLLAISNRPTATSVKVQPVVLLTICEAFNRRGAGCDRVGGTLLGSKEGNVIEIRNCYAVPLSEVGDQVGMDVVHHQTLYTLNRKVNPRDVIVGWFSSGYASPSQPDGTEDGDAANDWISGTDNLINDFYAKNRDSGSLVPPVFLKVDTGFSNGELGIKAYISRSINLGQWQLGTDFLEVGCEVLTTNLQKISSDVLSQASGVQPAGAPSFDSLHTAVSHLSKSLAIAQQYCADVADGRREGNLALGRILADAVSALPRLSPAAVDQADADDRQDMLLLLYLSQLVQAHLALADQLGTSALPLF